MRFIALFDYPVDMSVLFPEGEISDTFAGAETRPTMADRRLRRRVADPELRAIARTVLGSNYSHDPELLELMMLREAKRQTPQTAETSSDFIPYSERFCGPMEAEEIKAILGEFVSRIIHTLSASALEGTLTTVVEDEPRRMSKLEMRYRELGKHGIHDPVWLHVQESSIGWTEPENREQPKQIVVSSKTTALLFSNVLKFDPLSQPAPHLHPDYEAGQSQASLAPRENISLPAVQTYTRAWVELLSPHSDDDNSTFINEEMDKKSGRMLFITPYSPEGNSLSVVLRQLDMAEAKYRPQ